MPRLHRVIIIFLILVISSIMPCSRIYSQLKEENPVLKWSSWALLQAIPSPGFYDDRNASNSKLNFGFEWQVIPVSYSFNANKYISPLSFFFIRPVKRFSGSAEAFFEPSVVTGGYKYSALKKFSYKSGIRFIIPAAQRGEYLAFSLGAGIYGQEKTGGEKYTGVTYEAGVYALFGMLGLKFNYNQNAPGRFNFGVYIKYY